MAAQSTFATHFLSFSRANSGQVNTHSGSAKSSLAKRVGRVQKGVQIFI